MTTADAFGQLLWDHLHRGCKYQILERSDGLIDVVPVDVYFSTHEAWAEAERKAITFARRTVLDIGCGAGRHSLYLQDLGLDVLGIDRSPLAIEVCRERGLLQARALPVSRIGELRGQRFDTFLMLGHNLGLLESQRKGKRLLQRLATLSNDGSHIIGATSDPYDTQDPSHLAYHQWNRERGRKGGQIRLRERHRNLKGPWFDYLFLSQSELQEMVRDSGWRVERLIEDGPGYAAVLGRVPRAGGSGRNARVTHDGLATLKRQLRPVSGYGA
jgi:SAM-dependent methyltransferase